MENTQTNKEIEFLENIYKLNGEDQKDWEKLNTEISKDIPNEEINSFIKNKLLTEPDNELNIDLVDYIMDKGSHSIIAEIFSKDFIDVFTDQTLANNKDNATIYQQTLFLLLKWSSNLLEDTDYYKVLTEKYNKYKDNEAMPFTRASFNTYFKYVKEESVKKEENNEVVELNFTPLEDPFGDTDKNLLCIEFPADEKFKNKYSDLQISEIDLSYSQLRSKTIIKDNSIHHKKSDNFEYMFEEIEAEDLNNEDENERISAKEITSTFKNYKNDPVMFQNKWKYKIDSLNKWIKEGKESKKFYDLKQGIRQIILIGLDEIELIKQNCIEIGDDEGRNQITNIKSDLEQTCYRYECLIQGKKLEKFKSAFNGNIKKYYFDRLSLLEDKECNGNNNINTNGEEPKKETKMKKLIKKWI